MHLISHHLWFLSGLSRCSVSTWDRTPPGTKTKHMGLESKQRYAECNLFFSLFSGTRLLPCPCESNRPSSLALLLLSVRHVWCSLLSFPVFFFLLIFCIFPVNKLPSAGYLHLACS